MTVVSLAYRIRLSPAHAALMDLRQLPLVEASVRDTATFADAVDVLFAAAGAGDRRTRRRRARLVGAPRRARRAGRRLPSLSGGAAAHLVPPGRREAASRSASSGSRDEPVADARATVEPLDGAESQTHAAERLPAHRRAGAPGRRRRSLLGMLSIAALCHARRPRPRVMPARRRRGVADALVDLFVRVGGRKGRRRNLQAARAADDDR